MITIDHGFGYKTRYAHLQKAIVRKGQKVKRGQHIGFIGNTGKTTGVHLHYEVLKNDVPINPINFLYKDLTPDEYEQILNQSTLPTQTMDWVMDKTTAGKYYYSIGEVAAMFNVNTSMIRYWEKEFSVLRPRKNKKGNRLFTERDVRYVHVIYQLLKVKGYTLAGAKQALKERFSDYEERIILLETLDKTKCFLLDLDKALAEKQKTFFAIPSHNWEF